MDLLVWVLWGQRRDLNPRPATYGDAELTNCSTLRYINYQWEEISSSLSLTSITAVIALIDNYLKVFSFIRLQLAGSPNGVRTRASAFGAKYKSCTCITVKVFYF